ncbi:MAG TPA: NAD(P)/FAD-dependent oxidoreductase [Actinomycetota bacterium]|nr:NAD(P)/FAD-dependent oxidoreductase [Actinomycetota bacterium]
MVDKWDAVVVGGGHNGLVAAAYLARAGLRTVVCEAREVVGGAAVTERPWGPDYQVTSLSYVVSLLAPGLVDELGLERHGYKVYPQGPYFVPYAGGGYLQLPDDPARRREQIARFSAADADAMERWDAWMHDLAGVLGPLLSEVPPKLGSHRPLDLAGQARLAWRLRALDQRRVADATRLFTMSIADLLDEFFESPQMQGVLSVSGVIGTWAGPRSPGTAYVMAHHHIGDVGDGKLGSWGFPEGGMGGVSRALAAAATSFGAEIRTASPVGRITTSNGRATGVVLKGGEELRSDLVVAATHPKIAFLRLLDRRELPGDFVGDIERWKTRSGVVKVNLAVERLPELVDKPGFDPEVHGGTIVLAESLDDVEGGFQDAVAGRPSAKPFADICIPSVFDRTLCPPGQHIVSMFTQWVPLEWAGKPMDEELEAHADRVVARFETVAPGFTNSILHRQVIGPWRMEHEYGLVGGNIFHGELSASQLFHTRPAAGYADYRTPIRGLYQAGSGTHGGGGVTGIPGRNVVRQIRRDLRAERLRRRLRSRRR